MHSALTLHMPELTVCINNENCQCHIRPGDQLKCTNSANKLKVFKYLRKYL